MSVRRFIIEKKMKTISSIYLNHSRGHLSWVFKNSVSTLSINVQVGAYFAPMAVPETCCLTEPLNYKKLFLSTNSTIFINISIEICLCSFIPKGFLSAFNPALCEILG